MASTSEGVHKSSRNWRTSAGFSNVRKALHRDSVAVFNAFCCCSVCRFILYQCINVLIH
jgi:hypothetical protein